MPVVTTFKTYAPDGNQIEIPTNVDLASDPYSKLLTAASIHEYYHREGYVVRRNLIPPELCEQVKLAFEQEVKLYKNHIYRQASTNPERHAFTEYGYVLNSLLYVQDLNEKHFPQFKQLALSVLTHPNISDTVHVLLGEAGILVQSGYFEGNPVTSAHQDTYYLDSTELGRMTSAWVALEDIQPGAGRFYVYPGSQKLALVKNAGEFDLAFNHAQYKKQVLRTIDDSQIGCRAPALRKGDVIFWQAKTIHGSLETRQPQFSRSSLTAHFIPESTGLLQFQTRVKKLHLREINNMKVHCPKDQSKLTNRTIFWLETRFPQGFQFLKRLAIKSLVK